MYGKDEFDDWSQRLKYDLIGSNPGLSFCLLLAYAGIRQHDDNANNKNWFVQHNERDRRSRWYHIYARILQRLNLIFANFNLSKGVPKPFRRAGSFNSGGILFDSILRANSLHHRLKKVNYTRFANAQMGSFFAIMLKVQERTRLCKCLKLVKVAPKREWDEKALSKFIEALINALQKTADHLANERIGGQRDRSNALRYVTILEAVQKVNEISEEEWKQKPENELRRRLSEEELKELLKNGKMPERELEAPVIEKSGWITRREKFFIYNKVISFINALFGRDKNLAQIQSEFDKQKCQVVKDHGSYTKEFLREKFMYPEFVDLLLHGIKEGGLHNLLCIHCALGPKQCMLKLDSVLVNWTKIFTKGYEVESLEAYNRTTAENHGFGEVWWSEQKLKDNKYLGKEKTDEKKMTMKWRDNFLPDNFSLKPWGIQQIAIDYVTIGFLLGGTPSPQTKKVFDIKFLPDTDKSKLKTIEASEQNKYLRIESNLLGVVDDTQNQTWQNVVKNQRSNKPVIIQNPKEMSREIVKWLKTGASDVCSESWPWFSFAQKVASVLNNVEIEQYDIGASFFQSFAEDCLTLVTNREVPKKDHVKEFAWGYRAYPQHYLEQMHSDQYNSLHDSHSSRFFLVFWLAFCYVRCQKARHYQQQPAEHHPDQEECRQIGNFAYQYLDKEFRLDTQSQMILRPTALESARQRISMDIEDIQPNQKSQLQEALQPCKIMQIINEEIEAKIDELVENKVSHTANRLWISDGLCKPLRKRIEICRAAAGDRTPFFYMQDYFMHKVMLVRDPQIFRCPIDILRSDIKKERTLMKTATEAYKYKCMEKGIGNEARLPKDFFKAQKTHRNLEHFDQMLKDDKVMKGEITEKLKRANYFDLEYYKAEQEGYQECQMKKVMHKEKQRLWEIISEKHIKDLPRWNEFISNGCQEDKLAFWDRVLIAPDELKANWKGTGQYEPVNLRILASDLDIQDTEFVEKTLPALIDQVCKVREGDSEQNTSYQPNFVLKPLLSTDSDFGLHEQKSLLVKAETACLAGIARIDRLNTVTRDWPDYELRSRFRSALKTVCNQVVKQLRYLENSSESLILPEISEAPKAATEPETLEVFKAVTELKTTENPETVTEPNADATKPKEGEAHSNLGIQPLCGSSSDSPGYNCQTLPDSSYTNISSGFNGQLYSENIQLSAETSNAFGQAQASAVDFSSSGQFTEFSDEDLRQKAEFQNRLRMQTSAIYSSMRKQSLLKQEESDDEQLHTDDCLSSLEISEGDLDYSDDSAGQENGQNVTALNIENLNSHDNGLSQENCYEKSDLDDESSQHSEMSDCKELIM